MPERRLATGQQSTELLGTDRQAAAELQREEQGLGKQAEAGNGGVSEDSLSHFNEQGRARMVDISAKEASARTAVARTKIVMAEGTLQRIKSGGVAKGDVLAVSQVAGIMAAKNTSAWIPMCHPLPLTGVNISFADNGRDELYIEAEVKTKGLTGVEMEALTAVSAAALTVYDMCKAMQKDMIIGPTELVSKTGGKNGDYSRT